MNRAAGSRLLPAAAAGAVTLAAAQIMDMRLTGRPPSDVPARVVERLTGRTLQQGAARTVIVYGAQSSLALLAAAIAVTSGRRGGPAPFGAALTATVLLAGVFDAALGAAPAPWKWTPVDWTRECVLKGAMSAAVVAVAR